MEEAFVDVLGNGLTPQSREPGSKPGKLGVDTNRSDTAGLIDSIPGSAVRRDELEEVVARFEPLPAEGQVCETLVERPLDLEGTISHGQDFKARAVLDRELAEALRQPDSRPDLDAAGGGADEVDHALVPLRGFLVAASSATE